MTSDRILTTARLTLRPLVTGDATALDPIFRDAAALRYWHTLPHTSLAETQAMIAGMLAPQNACWWAICRTDADTAIGFIGYYLDAPITGMGYLLRPADCRQGLMTEAIAAALRYGFTTLQLAEVELWIHQSNLASQRLVHKAGFTRRGTFRQHGVYENAVRETWTYGLLASE